VRELRNLVERLLVLHGREPRLRPEHLPRDFHHAQAPAANLLAKPNGQSLEDAVNTYERQLVLHALRESHGVQTRAAEILGTTRRILKYRMVKLNIEDVAPVEE